ncbi:hypothetical protein F4780DRAFT_781447 [Xylariomycetidae sp. FL0641]|nr:hypothetical protein F4780DRAFT_781447 [Xylariomycetidae sp. FL0641]
MASDSDNNGPRLVISCWVLTALAGVFLVLRIYCKKWRGRGLWWDDYLMVFAWITLVIAVAFNTYITSLGFGRHIWTIDEKNQKIINLYTILVACFGIMATCYSKTSFAFTLYRIVTNTFLKYFIIFVIVTITVTMNLVWIFGLSKCTPTAKVFDKSVPGTCWDLEKLNHFYTFVGYYSAIMDFVLALLPWNIIMNMGMLKREKVGVAVAMSMGALAGVAGIVKAVKVASMTSPDITYDRVDLTIWTLAEPAISIMAACIPILRMLYRELVSSDRSYWRSKSRNTREATGSDKNRAAPWTRRPCGRSSTLVMSTGGWEESQEALQDLDVEAGDHNKSAASFAMGGIMKTAEVSVEHSRLSRYRGDDSFELAIMVPPPSYTKGAPDVGQAV